MNLPRLSRPAFDEIVIGIQFTADREVRSYNIGAIRNAVRAALPKISEVSPVPPNFENFGLLAQPSFSFQHLNAPPMPRYWFESSEGNDLLQVQSDKIYWNWRRRKPEDIYPGFDAVFIQFKAYLLMLQSIFLDEGIGRITINQCEISYINLLYADDDSRIPLEAVTNLYCPWRGDDFIYEDAILHCRRIFHRGDEPVGRLHVNFNPIVSPEGKPGLKVDFTARGRPPEGDGNAVFDFVNEQHNIIQQGFASVLKPSARQAWND